MTLSESVLFKPCPGRFDTIFKEQEIDFITAAQFRGITKQGQLLFAPDGQREEIILKLRDHQIGGADSILRCFLGFAQNP